MGAEEVRTHLQRKHRRGQHEADPEPPCHVGEFGIVSGVGGRDLRFERHAADRARTGSHLPNFRVHRTGVDSAFRHVVVGWRVGEIFLRVGGKLAAASGGTEIVGRTAVAMAVRRGVRIDGHAADRIERASSRPRVAMRVRSFGHAPATACDRYPLGVYSGHATGSQGVMFAAAQPDRGPGARPRADGRGRPLLYRRHYPDCCGADGVTAG